MNQSSTWRELHCVSFSLKGFAHLLSGCEDKWFTDNQAVPSIVHSGNMKEHLHILARDIFQTAKDKIDIEVEWIPPTQNERADYLSKIVGYDDWTVKDYYFRAVTSFWGSCSVVDCFASYKITRFPGSIPSILTQIPWVSIHSPLVGSAKHVGLCYLFRQ